MSQRDEVLALLQRGPAAVPDMAKATGINPASIQALLSKEARRGTVVCGGVQARDPWRLAGAETDQTADDPTMIPGGPEPACETRALAADEGEEPDEEMPGADAIALAVVAAARVTGEDPLRIAVPDAFVRARFPAVKALSILFSRRDLAAARPLRRADEADAEGRREHPVFPLVGRRRRPRLRSRDLRAGGRVDG